MNLQEATHGENFAYGNPQAPVRKPSTTLWHCPVAGCNKVFRHQSSRSRHVSNAHKKKSAEAGAPNTNKSTFGRGLSPVGTTGHDDSQERYSVRCRRIMAGSGEYESVESMQIVARFYFDEQKLLWELTDGNVSQVVEISFSSIENCVLNRVDPSVDVLRFRVSNISSLKGNQTFSGINWWDRNLEHSLSFDNGVIDGIIRRLPMCSFVMRVEIALIDSKDTNPNHLKEKVRTMLNYDKSERIIVGNSPTLLDNVDSKAAESSESMSMCAGFSSETGDDVGMVPTVPGAGKRRTSDVMAPFVEPVKAPRANGWMPNQRDLLGPYAESYNDDTEADSLLNPLLFTNVYDSHDNLYVPSCDRAVEGANHIQFSDDKESMGSMEELGVAQPVPALDLNLNLNMWDHVNEDFCIARMFLEGDHMNLSELPS